MQCLRWRFGLRRNAASLLLPALNPPDKPSIGSFLAALKACGATRDLEVARKVHLDYNSAATSANQVTHVANTMVSMYAKCGSIAEAQRVFNTMQNPDTVSWNTLILAYTVTADPDQALTIFVNAGQTCPTDSRTYVAALMACSALARAERPSLTGARVNALQKGLSVHSQARARGFDSDVYVAGALVAMYSRCGSMSDARTVFDCMVSPCVVLWTTLILGYAENGEEEVAVDMFDRMRREGPEPNARTFVAALVACTRLRMKEGTKSLRCLDVGKMLHAQAELRGLDVELFVASALIDMYSKCGCVGEAWKVFQKLEAQDVVSWTTMILGYAENGEGREALRLFELMQSQGGCRPSNQTYVAALAACESLVSESRLECLERVMEIHFGAAVRADIIVENALLDLYSKCGSMLDARAVFDRMKSHNVVSWTTLLHGYVGNEEHEVALEMFAVMRNLSGCSPDDQAFVTAIMACSGLADLETGAVIHSEICRAGVSSNRFIGNCLVDFYGRCGNAVKAEQMFDSMVTKDVVAWSSLLTVFSRVGDSDRVFQLFDEMRAGGVEPNALTYLSVLSACNHAGLVEKGKRLLESMVSGRCGVQPEIEHFHCVIDLLGRASHLHEAMALVKEMPHAANEVTWTIVLSACEKWKNVELGRVAFESLVALNDKLPAAYSLMAKLSGSEVIKR